MLFWIRYNMDMVKNFKNKKIAVIGMGVEGISSAEYLQKHGANVTILDREKNKDYLSDLDEYDLIVRSPGVEFSMLEKLVSKEKITSQTKLFFELCPCSIIGVTGTKGKGTTSSLIYEMLKKQGKDAYLGGNIGQPPFEFLDILNTRSIVVLELSSFQLQDLTKSPHIAVMLMITQEHLNVHGDVYSYIDAKRNLVRFQTKNDFAIFNKDYPASNESDAETAADVYKISREQEVGKGCFVKNGKIILRTNQVFKSEIRNPKSEINSNKEKSNDKKFFEHSNFEIIDTRDVLLPGLHNLENVCSAVLAATLYGVSKENIVSVLRTFRGLEHRLELVAEINGVKYYDDSFSTIPESTIAAIEAFENPKILILGGSSKNSDFTELGRVIENAKNIKAIIGIGKEWSKIKEKLQVINYKLQVVEGAKDMNTIVAECAKIALPEDVVLLSPACASFGMFKNYKIRGDQFKKEVENLKNFKKKV